MSKKVKLLIGLGIIVFIVATVLLVVKTGDKVTNYTTIKSLSEINKKEKVSVTLGREGCTWCAQFKDVMTEVSREKNVNVYYINNDNLDENHNYTIPLKCADSADQKILDGFGTPLTLVLENDEVKDCLNGYVDAKAFKAFLRKNDIIK